MLVTVGDLVEEVLVRLDTDPVRGGDISARSLRVRGGTAANVAAIAAELGGTPRLVGQVGDDAVGKRLAADLRATGVDSRVVHRGRSGTVVTLLGLGGRSRMIDRGAAAEVTALDSSCLTGATQLYVESSVFTEDPLAAAVDLLLGEAADLRLSVTLNAPSIAELDSIGPSAFLELCRALRPAHVVCNRTEHAALGRGGREAIDGADVTVVTNTRRPTLVIEGVDVTAVEVPPLDSIVDPTGVGAAFAAGFLTSRRTGADPVAATHAGHRVAARVLGQVGPTTGAKR